MATLDFGELLRRNGKKRSESLALHASKVCGVKKRMDDNMQMRRSSRLTAFDTKRDLSPCKKPVNKKDIRKQQLEKFKQEKEKKKKEEAAKKRKPFWLGTATRTPLNYVPPPPIHARPSTSGGVLTRSQAAKAKATSSQQLKNTQSSFAPNNAQFKPPALKNAGKLPTLAPLTRTKNKTIVTFNPVLPPKKSDTKPKSKIIKPTIEEPNKKFTNQGKNSATITTLEESNQPADKDLSKKSPVPANDTAKTTKPNEGMVTPQNLIPKSESGSEEKLRSPRIPPLTPEQIEDAKRSPYVTFSRGKGNERKEMLWKYQEGLMDDVERFRRQLSSEEMRLADMSNSWEKVLEQTELPEPVQDDIRAAVGQARLLMNKKMRQFADLIEQCAHPPPDCPLVTAADLEGFWDMVTKQIENVDLRFNKLVEYRERGWLEEQPAPAPRAAPVRAGGKKTVKPAATSKLRDIIAASRKARKEQGDIPSSPVSVALPEAAHEKTFEAGFFSVRSPVRSPVPRTPDTVAKRSLRKAVLSSEAKKAASRHSASFAMLRASHLGKDLDHGIAGVEPLPQTPLNSLATPGRSILKSTSKASALESGKKSAKQVIFNDTDFDSSNSSHISGMETALDTTFDITETTTTDIEGVKVLETELENSMIVESKIENRILVRQDAVDITPTPVKTKNRRTWDALKLSPEAVDSNTEQSGKKYSTRSSRRSTKNKSNDPIANNLASSLAIEEITPSTKTPKSPAKKKNGRSRRPNKNEQDINMNENYEQITATGNEENQNEEINKKPNKKTPKHTHKTDATSEITNGEEQNEKEMTKKTPRRSKRNVESRNNEQDVMTENNDHIDNITPRRRSKRTIDNKTPALKEVSINVVGETVPKRASRSRKSTASAVAE